MRIIPVIEPRIAIYLSILTLSCVGPAGCTLGAGTDSDADDDDNDNNNDDSSSGDDDASDDDDDDNDDTSGDADSDTDTDTDSDSDSDTDSDSDSDSDTDAINACLITGTPSDSTLMQEGSLQVDGQSYPFNPDAVETVRDDLFNPGYFSIFDVLVHLQKKGRLSLTYHFDDTKDTHVIDDLNGSSAWWYDAWYDGGWSEKSNQRMDYYPIKDKINVSIKKVSQGELDDRYAAWELEVKRRTANNGQTVIPEVWIEGRDGPKTVFENVAVRPFNLRHDILATGALTTADVILSLGEQGLISCIFEWKESIEGNEVKNYMVEQIDGWDHTGECGFVHEAGEMDAGIMTPSSGNHIHINPPIRIIHNPEYVFFKWANLGPCDE